MNYKHGSAHHNVVKYYRLRSQIPHMPLRVCCVWYMTDRTALGFCVTKHIMMAACILAHLPKCNLGALLMYYTPHFHYLAAQMQIKALALWGRACGGQGKLR